MRRLVSITDTTDTNLSKLWDILEDRGVVQFMGPQRDGHKGRPNNNTIVC